MSRLVSISVIGLAAAVATPSVALAGRAKPRAASKKATPKRAQRPKPPAVAEPEPEPVPDVAEQQTPAPVAASATKADVAGPLVTPDEGDGALGVTVRSRAGVPPARPWLQVYVDDGLLVRQLSYRDELLEDGHELRRYDLVANAVAAHVTIHPLRRLPGLALAASGELVVGAHSQLGATTFPTTSWEVQAAIHYGFAAGPIDAGVELGGGAHRFAIDDEMSELGELVPATDYRFVRAAATVSYPFARRASVTAALGWRQLVDTGELAGAQWFPRVTGNGADAALGVEVALNRGFVVYVRGQVRRYFFAMNPEVGDRLIVGGALDQYFGLAAGLSLAAR